MARLTRLATPLIKSDGGFREASWDEALKFAADGLGRIKSEHGGNAIGMFSCSKATNEVNYLAQKFSRTVLGSNNIDSCNRT